MARTLNWKVLLWTLAALVLAGVTVHLIHTMQVRGHAGVFLEYGDQAKEAKDLDQALVYYKHYLSIEPDDVAALTKYSLVLDQRAANPVDWSQIVTNFEKILERDPNNKDVREKL